MSSRVRLSSSRTASSSSRSRSRGVSVMRPVSPRTTSAPDRSCSAPSVEGCAATVRLRRYGSRDARRASPRPTTPDRSDRGERLLDPVGVVVLDPGDPGVLANHAICRRANRRVAITVRSRASSRVSSPARCGDHLLVADRPGRRPALGQALVEEAADLVDEAVLEHLRDPLLDPLLQQLAVDPRPICTVAGSTYSSCGSVAENGRPVSSMTSSARTIRRPLSGWIRAAASGSRSARPAMQVGGAAYDELGLQLRADAPGRCRGTRTGRGSPGCREPNRRPAPAACPRPAGRRSPRAPSPGTPPPSRVRGPSSRSSRWCGIPRRSATGSFAVPMSMPR